MTVSFEGINKGDRIRLTAANGDTAVFTVDSTATGGEYLYSLRHAFYDEDWDILEILSRVDPPLPTEPGFYVTEKWAGTRPALGYHLGISGVWRIIWSHGSPELREPTDLPLPLIRLVPEGATSD